MLTIRDLVYLLERCGFLIEEKTDVREAVHPRQPSRVVRLWGALSDVAQLTEIEATIQTINQMEPGLIPSSPGAPQRVPKRNMRPVLGYALAGFLTVSSCVVMVVAISIEQTVIAENTPDNAEKGNEKKGNEKKGNEKKGNGAHKGVTTNKIKWNVFLYLRGLVKNQRKLDTAEDIREEQSRTEKSTTRCR